MLKFILYFLLFSIILGWVRRFFAPRPPSQKDPETKKDHSPRKYFANKRKIMENDLAEDADYEEVK